MEIDDPATLAEVTGASETYERPSMENDTATLDALFSNSARAVRYGVDEIAAFRRARVGGATPRTLTRTPITTFGADLGTACLEYVRAEQAATGWRTQTWVCTDKGWRIVAGHLSQMANML